MFPPRFFTPKMPPLWFFVPCPLHWAHEQQQFYNMFPAPLFPTPLREFPRNASPQFSAPVLGITPSEHFSTTHVNNISTPLPIITVRTRHNKIWNKDTFLPQDVLDRFGNLSCPGSPDVPFVHSFKSFSKTQRKCSYASNLFKGCWNCFQRMCEFW